MLIEISSGLNISKDWVFLHESRQGNSRNVELHSKSRSKQLLQYHLYLELATGN